MLQSKDGRLILWIFYFYSLYTFPMRRLFLIFVLLTGYAHAQGCAACLNNASSAPPQIQRAMRHGILILLIPSSAILLGIATLAYRHRNHFTQDPEQNSEQDQA